MVEMIYHFKIMEKGPDTGSGEETQANTPPGKKKGLFKSLVKGRVGPFSPHKNPENLIEFFISYSFLPQFIISQKQKAIALLLPSLAKEIDEDEFNQSWESLSEDAEKHVLSIIKYQDEATCSVCDRKEKGLWVDDQWIVNRPFKRDDLFIECPRCKTILCPSCSGKNDPKDLLENTFRGNWPYCPTCHARFPAGRLFLLDAPLSVSSDPPFDNEIEMDDDHADIHHIRQYKTKIINPRVVLDLSVPNDSTLSMLIDDAIEFGDKGEVEIHFHNEAAKIEDKWYLTGAMIDGF